jgi:CubicO group peptidase (beta-lactamase class C family)
MNVSRSFVSILLIIFCLFSCEKQATDSSGFDYTYQIPAEVYDDWDVSSLSDVGMNESNLVEMMNFINNSNGHQIHSIIIIKDNKLVFEEYFSGHLFDTDRISSEGPYIQYDRDTLHFMASVTKSVTSVLFGMAMDKGLAGSVNTKLVTFYPDYASILTGQKSDITIQHILTMTAGLAWDESTYYYGDSRNDVTGLFNAGNPIAFVLSKQLESTPGQQFHYNSGYANIMADMIKVKHQYNIKFLADLQLFGPLKVKKYRWDMIRSDYVFASGGLYMKPRDLAKIGQLYLNGGVWDGYNLISQDWISKSTQNYIDPGWINFSNGYGYQWWLYNFNVAGKSYDCFMAVGWGEQIMYVFPAQELVIVMNCGYFFTAPPFPLHKLVQNYILKSIG